MPVIRYTQDNGMSSVASLVLDTRGTFNGDSFVSY